MHMCLKYVLHIKEVHIRIANVEEKKWVEKKKRAFKKGCSLLLKRTFCC